VKSGGLSAALWYLLGDVGWERRQRSRHGERRISVSAGGGRTVPADQTAGVAPVVRQQTARCRDGEGDASTPSTAKGGHHEPLSLLGRSLELQ
jgi:hypothetical protein